MSAFQIEPIANYHCFTGENPLWDERRQLLYWADIPNGRLFQYDPASNEHQKRHEGGVIGGFTFQESGKLLLFRDVDVAEFDPDSGQVEVVLQYTDDSMERFNDVIADPEGRVFAGTIGKTKDSGGLYRVDLDGTFTKLFAGSGCSNGMVFNAELNRFWWTCSSTKKIFQFDYDRATGELSNRSVFLDLSNEKGIPDGLTIDIEGNFWSAVWEGAQLRRFSPEGTRLEGPSLPVPKITSAIFGGPELQDLYVTSASCEENSTGEDGTLYRIKTSTRGRPEFRSRIKAG